MKRACVGILLVGLLLVSMVSAAAAATPAPWPTDRQNMRRSAVSPNPAPLAPVIAWTYKTGGAIEANPIVGPDGVIYFGSTDGFLYALTPGGELKWKAAAKGAVLTPALLPDGGLVVGSLDDGVYVFSKDGKLRWRFETGGNVEGAPAVGPNGTIYIGSGDGNLYALNPDGRLRWRYSTGGPIYGAPALFEDLVLVGSFDKKLHAVNRASGQAVWTSATLDNSEYGIYAGPAVDENGVSHVGNIDRRFYAIDKTGHIVWEMKFGSPVITASALFNGSVILATGKALVRHTEQVEPAPAPKGASAKLALRGPDWIFLAPETIASSPSISGNGLVLVGCDDAHLYALNVADGKMRWKLKLDGRVGSSPSIGASGVVYVGTDSGSLVAIVQQPETPEQAKTDEDAATGPEKAQKPDEAAIPDATDKPAKASETTP
jgi:outer membrane protein assembly factor BamB